MSSESRILITGAGGFVGYWLINRLAAVLPKGAHVLATGHANVGSIMGAELDVTQADAVDALVRGFRPSALVHLAGISSLVNAQADNRKAWNVNLFGTLNLAEAVMRHAPQARFVFAGSSEVYGGSFNVLGGIVDETALLDPRNPYATTKAAADLLLGQMAEAGLRAIRLRLFNHTGPGQSTHFAVPAFASQIAAAERGEREAVIRVGNLDSRRDFLDVRDVVEAYRLALEAADLPAGTVLNVASGLPRRIGDVLDTLLGMSRTVIRVDRDEALIRSTDVPVMAGDARRAKELLGWRPTIDWGTTLRDVLDSHRRLRP